MQNKTKTKSTRKNTPANLSALPEEENVLIPAAQAPKYIGLKKQTLARRRHEGVPPRFIRLGRRVYYRASDLREWIQSQVCENTIS
jgi:predicted DNA-binding transcriptional regulator AlpA